MQRNKLMERQTFIFQENSKNVSAYVFNIVEMDFADIMFDFLLFFGDFFKLVNNSNKHHSHSWKKKVELNIQKHLLRNVDTVKKWPS